MPWCAGLVEIVDMSTCVRAKSKQNHSRTLKTKQPVIQLDYAFLGDNSDDSEVTLLTAIDLLSGLGLSCVVPSKGRLVYAQAELRRFILETGRTCGILQNLYAQVRALKLDLEARYPGFDLPTKHPLFSWLV